MARAVKRRITETDRADIEDVVGEVPLAYLALVVETHRRNATPARYVLNEGRVLVAGGGDSRMLYRDSREDVLVVPDPWMSSRHVSFSFRHDRWVMQDTDSKNGSLVNGRRVGRHELSDGDVVELGRTLFVFRHLTVPASTVVADILDGDEIPWQPGVSTLVPACEIMLQDLHRVAPSTVPVHLHGESGTGKELIAQAIHQRSDRSGPFIAVNCGAIAKNLIESELFGYHKGAFSGAERDKIGLIQRAHGGTLFLDEVAELSSSAQTALLRALQEQQVRPIGSTDPVDVEVRFVSATLSDLAALAAQERFRTDLWARLAGFVLELPPLRSRREDIGLILAARRRDDQRGGPTWPSLSHTAARCLLCYRWPHNFRELEQALATAVLLAENDVIQPVHLPEEIRKASGFADAINDDGTTMDEAVRKRAQRDATRRAELLEQLRRHGGNISAVARALQKDRSLIHRWIRRYGIRKNEYIDGAEHIDE